MNLPEAMDSDAMILKSERGGKESGIGSGESEDGGVNEIVKTAKR